MFAAGSRMPALLLIGIVVSSGWVHAHPPGTLLLASAVSADETTTTTPAAQALTESVDLEVPVLTVTGRRTLSAASDSVVRAKDFQYLPRVTPSDLVRVVPGLQVSQHTGGAKAYQYSLRGFDAEHGQDMAVYLDGIPLNETSHIHGHGYLDLHFLIPEAIEKIQLLKGSYDSDYGNFAVAGVIDFVPYSAAEHNEVSATYGSFRTGRGLVIGGHQSVTHQTYVAGDLETTQGYTNPGAARAYRGFARYRYQPSYRNQFTLTLAAYDQDSAAADVVPENVVQNGMLGRFDSIDASGAVNSARYLAGGRWTFRKKANTVRLLAYGQWRETEIYSNTTYFLNDPVYGDQRAQKDQRIYGGARLTWSWTGQVAKWAWSTRLGLEWRADQVDQLYAASQTRMVLDPRVDAAFTEHHFGWIWRKDFAFTPWMRLVGGTRIDAIFYEGDATIDQQVFDIQTNTVRVDQDVPLSWHSRAWATSPKTSLIFSLPKDIQLFLNYGEGFFSNPTLRMAEAPGKKLPKVRNAELGWRAYALQEKLNLAGAVWWADKERDVLFDAESGQSLPISATRRYGADFEGRYAPVRWLYLGIDLAYTRTLFRATGNPIPNIPEITQTHLAGVRHEIVPAGGQWISKLGPFMLHGTLRGRHTGARDLALGFREGAYYLLDGEIGLDTDHWDIDLSVVNLLGTAWRDGVFAYTSRPASNGPNYTGVHYTPGAPRMLRLQVAAKF